MNLMPDSWTIPLQISASLTSRLTNDNLHDPARFGQVGNHAAIYRDHLPGGGQDFILGGSGKRVLWNQVLGSTKIGE